MEQYSGCGRATGNDGKENNGFVKLVELYMVFGSFNIGVLGKKVALSTVFFGLHPPQNQISKNVPRIRTIKCTGLEVTFLRREISNYKIRDHKPTCRFVRTSSRTTGLRCGHVLPVSFLVWKTNSAVSQSLLLTERIVEYEHSRLRRVLHPFSCVVV